MSWRYCSRERIRIRAANGTSHRHAPDTGRSKPADSFRTELSASKWVTEAGHENGAVILRPAFAPCPLRGGASASAERFGGQVGEAGFPEVVGG